MDNFVSEPCLITADYVNTFIKKRRRELHKGDCGRVLVIAGSPGMAGAAVLCVRGAFRGGAGLVRVAVAEELFGVVQGGVAEATCISRALLSERLTAGEALEEYQAVVMGPGLGLGAKNARLVELVLKAFRGPVVLDADGLTLLAEAGSTAAAGAAAGGGPQLILTPHPGEAGRLLGLSGAAVNEDRSASALRIAEERQAVTVLKGAGTLVAVPGGATYINTTGNPGMATGGSGDVLAGLIGALAGQGLPVEAAAAAGVYLHGLAGDLAARRLGEYSLMASDIAEALPAAFRRTMRQPADRMQKGYKEMGALNAALAEEGPEAAAADLNMYEKWVLESEENDGKER